MKMKAKLYGLDGSEKGTTALPDELFAQPVHEHLMWLSVKRHLGNQRQGTAMVKSKGLVSGGGKKPFKQKGTGNARQGSNTSPLMPGGGRAFGPKPHSHRTEMPKQQRRAALVSALSLRAGEDAVCVIEGLPVEAAPKTSQVASVLKKIGLDEKKTLLVVGQHNDTVWKSVRNLRHVKTTLAHQLNAYDLLDCEQLLLTQDGLTRVTEVFSR
jgi:large subunit ribosomal protein L4